MSLRGSGSAAGRLRHRRAAELQGHRRRRRELQFLSADRPRRLHPDALRKARRDGRPALLPGADGASGRARHRLPAAGADTRRRAMVDAERPAAAHCHLSRPAFRCAGPMPRIAPPPALRWRGCTRRAKASRSRRANALGPDGLARSWPTRRQPAPTTIEGGLAALIDDALADAGSATGRSDLPGGVIHADLFPDNVLFMQRQGVGPDRFLFRLQRLPRL